MIGRVSREARPSPGARPARGQAHRRPLTPPVAVCVAVAGGVAVFGRGGGIACRGPAVGLAGARRRGAPVQGRAANPGSTLKTTRYLKKFRLIPRYFG